MLSSMITLNKDQTVADQLGNLRIECIVGTEDGSFVVYLDKTTKELILCGHWVLIAGDDDVPERAYRPRPVFGRGRTLEEASLGLLQIYGENFWKKCYVRYLRPYESFECELFREWKKRGLEEFDAERQEFCNNTPQQIQSSYQRFLKEK